MAFLRRARVCLDVGSSTGGFTDCLLQHGALRVYAVDVSADQLDWKLRKDPRVVTIERNARYLRAGDIPERVTLITMDVAFISVTKVLPAVVPLAPAGADFLILIKPQFELEKREVGKGGIVRDAFAASESNRARDRRSRWTISGHPRRASKPFDRSRGQSGVFSPRPRARVE